MVTLGEHIFDHLVGMMGNAPGSIVIGIAVADVEDLPHRVRHVAVVHEMLRQCNRIGIHFSKLGPEIVKPRRCRSAT